MGNEKSINDMLTFTDPHLPDGYRTERRQDISARNVIDLVLEERKYQKSRWTDSRDLSHSLQDWASIMSTWLGKVYTTVPPYRTEDAESKKAFKKRVVQLAAICVAALEQLESD